MLTVVYNGTPYLLEPRGLETLMRLTKLRADSCEMGGDRDGKALEVLILAVLGALAQQHGWSFDGKREVLVHDECGHTATDHRDDEAA